ncbi:MAG: nitroreductase family protein [Prevotella sp.]|nr:nitroreductase family protein [Prevotella sp.]
MKKNLFAIAALSLVWMGVCAQEVKQLPQPDMTLSVTLMEALQKRSSDRSYNADKPVNDQQLSQILWAACGVNRPDKNLLTIPTAINAQDIVAYVCTKDGVSIYDPKKLTLTKVTAEDIRPALAGMQESMKSAPVFILLVSDQSKFRQESQIYGAMDAGYASQDICLMCAALGLKTVPRAMMNKEAVSKALGLPATTILELNHPVGY